MNLLEQIATLLAALILMLAGVEWIGAFADLIYMWALRRRLVFWTSLCVYGAIMIAAAMATSLMIGATAAAIATPIIVRRLADWIAWTMDAAIRQDAPVAGYIFKAARAERRRRYVAPPIIVDDNS